MLRNVAESIGELSDTLVILSADTLIIRYWYRGVSPASLRTRIKVRFFQFLVSFEVGSSLMEYVIECIRWCS